MNEEEQKIKKLIQELKHEEWVVYYDAYQSLVDMGELVVPYLIKALKGQDKDIRPHAIVALGEIGDLRAIPVLAEAANNPNVYLRMLAVRVLGDIVGNQILPIIAKALSDANLDVHYAARDALGKIGIDEKDFARLESQYRSHDFF